MAKAAEGRAEQVAAEGRPRPPDAAPPPADGGRGPRWPPRPRRATRRPTRRPTTTGDGERSDPAALAEVADELAAEGAGRGQGRALARAVQRGAAVHRVRGRAPGRQRGRGHDRALQLARRLRAGRVGAGATSRCATWPTPRPAAPRRCCASATTRRFVVVAVDTPRRGIDLALPGVVDVPAADLGRHGRPAGRAGRRRDRRGGGPRSEATAPKPGGAPGRARKAAAKKAAAKKAPAKKAAAKKAAGQAGGRQEGPGQEGGRRGRRRPKQATAKKAAGPKTAAKQAARKPAPEGRPRPGRPRPRRERGRGRPPTATAGGTPVSGRRRCARDPPVAAVDGDQKATKADEDDEGRDAAKSAKATSATESSTDGRHPPPAARRRSAATGGGGRAPGARRRHPARGRPGLNRAHRHLERQLAEGERIDRVDGWLDIAEPDVLCLQETKLADDAFPALDFHARGYDTRPPRRGALERRRHPQPGRPRGRRWRASPTASPPTTRPGWSRPRAAACGCRRCTSRTGGPSATSTTTTSCAGWPACGRTSWPTAASPVSRAVCGDFNVAPDDIDVWSVAAFEGDTHVTPEERAAIGELEALGLRDAFREQYPATEGLYTWWDYRAGNFHKHRGMRIDLVLLSSAAGRPGDLGAHRPQRPQGPEAERPRPPVRRRGGLAHRLTDLAPDGPVEQDLAMSDLPPGADDGPAGDRPRPVGPGSPEWPDLLHDLATAAPSPRRAEMHRMGQALRRIVHRLHGSPAPDAELAAAADELERLADRLDAFPNALGVRGLRRVAARRARPARVLRPQPDAGPGQPAGAAARAVGRRRRAAGAGHLRLGLRGPARLRPRRLRRRGVRRGARARRSRWPGGRA